MKANNTPKMIKVHEVGCTNDTYINANAIVAIKGASDLEKTVISFYDSHPSSVVKETPQEIIDMINEGTDYTEPEPTPRVPRARFGQLTNEGEDRVPTLEIILADGFVGYLSARNGDRFEVSTGKDETQYAYKSHVFTFNNMINEIPDYIASNIIYAAAVEALSDFCVSNYNVIPPYNVTMGVFNKFMNRTRTWLLGRR